MNDISLPSCFIFHENIFVLRRKIVSQTKTLVLRSWRLFEALTVLFALWDQFFSFVTEYSAKWINSWQVVFFLEDCAAVERLSRPSCLSLQRTLGFSLIFNPNWLCFAFLRFLNSPCLIYFSFSEFLVKLTIFRQNGLVKKEEGRQKDRRGWRQEEENRQSSKFPLILLQLS